MNHLTSESVELADRCRLRLADPRLSYQVARLYSQHTRLGANEAGLRSWTRTESADRLDDAVRLIDAGLVLRRAGRETYRDCLRRAGELLEWLSHPGMGLGDVPLRLLSAAAYQLAGYPARAFALLRQPASPGQESEVLRAFLRADLPGVLSRAALYWADVGPQSLASLAAAGGAQGGVDRTREWVVWETVGALAVLCSALRWEDESRLGRAVEKMRAVASVLAPATDRFSWLLAKLSAEAAAEYASRSFRALLGELRARLSSTGRQAVDRYLRLGFEGRRALAWPSQASGIRRLLGKGSFVLCTPTGSGKTTVAELAILQALFEPEGGPDAPLTLYLVPSRALAAEVEAKLTRVFRRLTDRRRVVVTGLYGGNDWGPTDAWLTAEDPTVLICTYEKGEALMRFLGPLFLGRVSLVLLDEAHSVQFDGDRGGLRSAESRSLRLEALGMRLFNLARDGRCRTVALSAVAAGIDESLQAWVTGRAGGEPVRTDYRSTRQMIGRLEVSGQRRFAIHYDLLDGADLRFAQGESGETPYVPNPFPPCPPAPGWDGQGPEKRLRPALLWAALHLAAPDENGARHGVLISITQRIQAYADDFLRLLDEVWAGQGLPDYFARPGSPAQLLLWERCRRVCADYFGEDSAEYRLLVKGIAFHHGKMPAPLARLLTALVQEGIVSLVVATSTLSEGVNLPLETILVPSLRRTTERISAREFMNLAGRAGRPGVGTEGRTLVLLVADEAGGRDLAREEYLGLIRELSAPAGRGGPGQAPVSPLAELLSEVWRQWQRLTASSDHPAFLEWLETTAPSRVRPTESQAVHPAVEALDSLDGILLPAIVELEEGRGLTDTEGELQRLWGQSFAVFTAAREEQREAFVRRGLGIRAGVYPDRVERRRLYRTGLPPRSGYQLIEMYPAIRAAMGGGADYAVWPPADRLAFVAQVVGLVGNIARFRYAERIGNRQVDWRHVLAWWLAPRVADHDPGARRRAEWHGYVSKNFVYRFCWGLGSVIGLATDELHAGRLLAPRLEDWPRTGLPWVVFWLKELIHWGTLEPVAAFLLAGGLAETRSAAEALARGYYRHALSLPEPGDPLDASAVRRWAEETIAPLSDEPPTGPPREIEVELLEDFSGHEERLWHVLPVIRGGEMLWADPAGFPLAHGTVPPGWDESFLNRFDFLLDAQKRIVRSRVYL